jgi:hypothetical protein
MNERHVDEVMGDGCDPQPWQIRNIDATMLGLHAAP